MCPEGFRPGETLERSSVSDLLDKMAALPAVGIARPISMEPKPQADLGSGPLPQPG